MINQQNSSSLKPSIIDQSNMNGYQTSSINESTGEVSQQIYNSPDMFKQFLVKLFQDEKVMSLSDARLTIEQNFQDNFKPNRDLLDYLIEKQLMSSKNQKQATSFVNKDNRYKVKTKNRMVEGFYGLQKRRKSNASKQDIGYDSSEIGSAGSDNSQDEYDDQDMDLEEEGMFGRQIATNINASSDRYRPKNGRH